MINLTSQTNQLIRMSSTTSPASAKHNNESAYQNEHLREKNKQTDLKKLNASTQKPDTKIDLLYKPLKIESPFNSLIKASTPLDSLHSKKINLLHPESNQKSPLSHRSLGFYVNFMPQEIACKILRGLPQEDVCKLAIVLNGHHDTGSNTSHLLTHALPKIIKNSFKTASMHANSITDDNIKIDALKSIVKSQKKSGFFSQTKKNVDPKKPVNQKFNSTVKKDLSDLARKKFNIAIKKALSASNPLIKASALKGIAEQQANAGFIDGAKNTFSLAITAAHSISNQLRDHLFIELTEAQAQSGFFSDAKKTTDLLSCDNEKAEALITIELAKVELCNTTINELNNTPDTQSLEIKKNLKLAR